MQTLLRLVTWSLIGGGVAFRLFAHDIITTNLTYSRDISRILGKRCLTCHGAGSSIPLTSYQEVRPWAVDIKDQVLSRAMPPWGAVKGFGDLKPDDGLSQEEIMIIAAWVIGGAPQGNPALFPKMPSNVIPPSSPPVRDLQTVATRTVLTAPVRLAGIRPEANASSVRITARTPDGRIEPLLWLYHFNAGSSRTFFFREPVPLPSGTVIESSDPLRFALESSATEISPAP
ncbi:MAG: cytochrome c [Acidobacteriaceae bacterium]|nr:cytochrome c [Acidobacteriaceae bacterium]MBV8572027.1 cytochrome c [Acidobacteriaceae bacterium]